MSCRFRTVVRTLPVACLPLLGVSPLSAQPAHREPRLPVNVAALSSGDLIVLEQNGGMLRVNPQSGRGEVLVQEFLHTPLDLEVVRLGDGGEAIFLSLLHRDLDGQHTYVQQYSANGKLIREGEVSPPATLFSGIAVDPSRQTAWLVNGSNFEIDAMAYPELSPNRLSAVKRLVRLSDVGVLGALAYDVKDQRLFVTDSARGTLVAVALDSPTPELIAEGLGEPQAFAVDAVNRRLYVADAAGLRIWVLDLTSPVPEKRLFTEPSKAPELRSLTSLTVAPDGTVWVADWEANKLFALRSDGSVVKTLP